MDKMIARVPYGRGCMEAEVAPERFLGVFFAPVPEAAADQAAEVKRALDAPIGSPPLEELAKGRRNAVIIISDHTRPVPSRFLIPPMLERLRRFNPGIDITLLVATGCHRPSRREELVEKLGEEVVAHERIVMHDSRDDSAMVDAGLLPSGGRLRLNRVAMEADLLVSEGFIEPHFFAGFSGGRKSILPGVASRVTVLANHCAAFIADPKARTGSLDGNPIHRDMVYAAEKARLAFVLNVVINPEKKIVRAFAGAERPAHAAGCAFLGGVCRVKVPEADIVVTSNGGHPLDQNVYQTVKGMTAGEAACREGGVIVISSACGDGHGGEAFYKMLSGAASPKALLDEIAKVPSDKTQPDQWEAQILARILCRNRVIVVTRDCDHALLRSMGLLAASNLREALDMATALTSPDSKIAVIPDGVSTIPVVVKS
ncbi:MAG: nickel-dependent lactate racemase [Kiritimatiellae bacterium]|nr:nickel-dependent lactate racemase [Kiritimatiellia bacterium]